MSATGRNDNREPDDFAETPGWCTDLIIPHLNMLPCGPPHDIDGRRRRMLLEPTAGRGAICERLVAHGVPLDRIMAIEFHSGRALAFQERVGPGINNWDFLAWADHVLKRNAQPGLFSAFSPWRQGLDVPIEFDCIITNPPFSIALQVIERSLALVRPRRGEVAMLLRLGFLASAERVAFHREHPSDVYILPKRPSFFVSISCTSKGCGWKVRLPLDAPRPTRCEACENNVAVSTSDSTDYCWAVWGPGRGGRWSVLESPAGNMTSAPNHDRSAEV